MKRIIFFLFCTFLANVTIKAQLGGIFQQILMSGGPKNMEKSKTLYLGTIAPFSIENVVLKGQRNIPILYSSFDFGLVNNITLGVLGGYALSTSQFITNPLDMPEQFAWENDHTQDKSFAKSINPDYDGIYRQYRYKVESKYIGLQTGLYYNTKGKMDLFFGIRAGFKKIDLTPIGEYPQAIVTDEIISAVENLNKIFYSVRMGGRYHINDQFGISIDFGAGSGYGDNIGISDKNIIACGSVFYNFHKTEKQNTTQ